MSVECVLLRQVSSREAKHEPCHFFMSVFLQANSS